jgi:hypothetical protein
MSTCLAPDLAVHCLNAVKHPLYAEVLAYMATRLLAQLGPKVGIAQ